MHLGLQCNMTINQINFREDPSSHSYITITILDHITDHRPNLHTNSHYKLRSSHPHITTTIHMTSLHITITYSIFVYSLCSLQDQQDQLFCSLWSLLICWTIKGRLLSFCNLFLQQRSSFFCPSCSYLLQHLIGCRLI